jgi:hypothetical protein
MRNNMKTIFCFYLLIFSANSFLFAQGGGNTTLVGRWAAGPPYAFTVEDNIIYTASGGILQILDISNPSEPQLLGQVSTNGIISDVAKEGNYVYLAAEDSGLKIIDVSDLTNPIQISELLLPSPAIRLIVNNQTVFIAEGEYDYGTVWTCGGLRIVDVTNPFNPQPLGSYAFSSPRCYITQIEDYIYMLYTWDETLIIDVSDLANPTSAGTPNARFGNSYLSGSLLYVASIGGGLLIYDVTNPVSPNLLGQSLFQGGAEDVTVIGNYAYVTNAGYNNQYRLSQISIYDISDSMNPLEVGIYESSGDVYMISNFNNTIIVSEDVYHSVSGSEEGNGLRILDASDPFVLQPIRFYDMPGVSTDVVVRDNYAFVSTLYGGISIVDVHDINNPIQIGYYNSPGTPLQVTLQDNYAYLVELNRGLRIIDITDLTNPIESSSYDMGETFSKVVVSGNYAFVLVGEGMHIFDITDPEIIISVSTIVVGSALSLLVDGNTVYVSVGYRTHWGTTGGIKIYDVENPGNPVKIGEYDAGGGLYEDVFYPHDIALKNNYLYVVSDFVGLRVFDVSDPTNLIIVSDTPTFGDEIDIYQNYAFLSESLVGINIFDIYDPLNPELVETYDEFRRINGLTLDNQGKIYTASTEYGMMIFKNDLVTSIREEDKIIPAEFSLNQNYPNPFNPSTKISYLIPSGDYVTLKVYDILGNEISILVSEYESAGSYEIDFNGSEISTGVYLYVLRYGNNMLTKKMVLIK